MKIDLELIINDEPDGRKFINYWDYNNGNDVCCEVIDDKLFTIEYDNDGNVIQESEITLSEFLRLIEVKELLNFS